jgi:2-polyprenyl-6-methoxyphenol hydroxylase-like FAD-dependent oxidoreductase
MSRVVSTQASERVLILGGGMAGLATALALQDSGRAITIIERDPAPPEIAPVDAFEQWKRPGVPQLRHTHIFLSRLQTILRRHHPSLLSELERAGIVSGAIGELLSASQASRWQAIESDEDLLPLWGRRATFEYLLRRHVQRQGQVKFVHDTAVEKLMVEVRGPQLRVTGVEVRGASGSQVLGADIVVDALGVRSKTAEWLNAHGAQIKVERVASRCGYYCRHFAASDNQPMPPRRDTGGSLDYLVFGVFFAEQNTFSIAITCPESESELLEKLKRPEGFDDVARQIPAARIWRERAEPISRVLGGAELANRWNHFRRDGNAQILGYFPVGDSYIQTNPIYGRGCSSAFVQAHALADTLRETSDPAARARSYHRTVWRQMRPHFDFCRTADHAFWARARNARGEAVSLRDRLGNRFYDAAFLPALEQSPLVAREWLKAQQMGEPSPPWVAVVVLLYMLLLWPLRVLMRAQKRLPRVGPLRSEMLQACLPVESQRKDAG